MENPDRGRRLILKGALGAGCAIALPPLLAGCGEQAADEQGAAGESLPPATDVIEGPDKIAKQEAEYQGQPNGDERCGLCRHFVAADNTCRQVKGKVSPSGWCTMWVAKA